MRLLVLHIRFWNLFPYLWHCLKSKAVICAQSFSYLDNSVQCIIFLFPSRHPAVGLKREQKRDHISARHRGEVLISWKRWEVLHSWAFQGLIHPRHFLNPIWSPGNGTLSLSSSAFETSFTPNLRVVWRVIILCLLDFLPAYYEVLVVKEWPEWALRNQFLVACLLFSVTLVNFLTSNAALLEEAKCQGGMFTYSCLEIFSNFRLEMEMTLLQWCHTVLIQ